MANYLLVIFYLETVCFFQIFTILFSSSVFSKLAKIQLILISYYFQLQYIAASDGNYSDSVEIFTFPAFSHFLLFCLALCISSLSFGSGKTAIFVDDNNCRYRRAEPADANDGALTLRVALTVREWLWDYLMPLRGLSSLNSYYKNKAYLRNL